MKMTNCCRICLSKKAQKDVSELQCDIPEIDKNHQDQDIMLFCLDVQVSECPQVSKSLCNKCYKKVISFYIFKVQAIKNDAYLRSLQNTEQDKDTNMQEHIFFLKVDTGELDRTTEQDKNTNLQDNIFLLKAEETEEPEIKIEANFDVFDDQSDQLSLNYDLNYLNIKAEDTQDNKKDDSDNDMKKNNRKIRQNSLSEKNCKTEDTKDTEKDESDNDMKRKNRKIRQNSLTEKNCKTEENCKISSNISMKAPPKKRGSKKKLKTEQGVIPQECKQCGKSFTNLKDHMKQHKKPAGPKIYQCKNCPKIFYNYDARYKHINRHHPMLKKTCTICDNDYLDLNAHTLNVHNKEKLRFVCTVCESRHKSRFALNKHLRSHTQDKPYQCDKCNKKFKSKLFVAMHIRNVHDQEKPHMCHLCSKSYFKKHALQVHIRLHTKELPYTCDECGKGFRTYSFLKNHSMRHTGDKKFACTLCHKKFYEKGALSVHMIHHTKVKPFSCSFCDMKFGRKDHKKQHELTIHGHKTTYWEFCPDGFGTSHTSDTP